MFITAFFSREQRQTSATRAKVKMLENSRRRDKNTIAEAMEAVTARANQNRAGTGSV
jgi:hypothetical protein